MCNVLVLFFEKKVSFKFRWANQRLLFPINTNTSDENLISILFLHQNLYLISTSDTYCFSTNNLEDLKLCPKLFITAFH